MNIVVIGATGGTGRQLVHRALERGHTVHALIRNPDTANLPTHANLSVSRADVRNSATITDAIATTDTVVSGLGVPTRADAGTLSAGATAVAAARPARIVWLGAAGVGPSRHTMNPATGWLLRKGFGAEYDDKVTADTTVLNAGGIVLHSGPLSDKPDDPSVTAKPVGQVSRRLLPFGAPRSSIARLMIDFAEDASTPSDVYVIQRR